MRSVAKLLYFAWLVFSCAVASSVAAQDQRQPQQAVSGLDVAEGLQAQLFASEPDLLSLTNLDIDYRGRIWVCEVVNYRKHNGRRPEGDRILILEDTDGDGRSDRQKVFYQGRDVDSAMGICVLGSRVIVSCSPNVLVFTDSDGDDKPDRKDVLFSKTGQPQHDHSAHSFLFGPDGKLYWNFGNTGKAVHDSQGRPVVDRFGHQVVDNGRPYFGGMAFRCDGDGSNFEVLGHNFRNNYEVAVDSFGTLWQSDNDDDGNRGVRINYVMEHGNFGYLEENTGRGWREPRTGMHSEIPKRHWHLNDPGVVPNLLQTGAGSPTGILVYEGRLLPKVFWDQVIHCDAGPNIVRAYPVRDDGAGYSARIVDLVHGARDNWFRPADVCVAPDGSLFITDWYDPGVGGHNMGDLDRGRLFRVAPPDHDYQVPEFDFASIDGAVEALQNPCLSVRYLAWTALHEMGAEAEPALRKLYDSSDNPRMRARALWLLGKIPGRADAYVTLAAGDAKGNLRIAALRLARQSGGDVLPLVERLARDASPQVRRECASALRGDESDEMPRLWARLAAQYDGQDRWYLEALGIGAELRWDDCLEAWLQLPAAKQPPARGVVWRSRGSQTPRLLKQWIAKCDTADEATALMRAFDFQADPARQEVLLELAFAGEAPPAVRDLVATEAVKRLGGVKLQDDPQYADALDRMVRRLQGTEQFVELVDRFDLQRHYPALLQLARDNPESTLGVSAMVALLEKGQQRLVRDALRDADPARSAAIAAALGNTGHGRAARLLEPIMKDEDADLELRRQATRGLARTRNGAQQLLELARTGRLPEPLQIAAASTLGSSPLPEIRQAAADIFPPPPAKNNEVVPPVRELVGRTGDARRGREVFRTSAQCATCHVVNGDGKEVGPNLSEIGKKLSKQALLESIVFPSAGINHNYENYLVQLEDGTVVNGILQSRTPEQVVIRTEKAITRTIAAGKIARLRRLEISLMPSDLQKQLTVQDLVDVVEYLTTLKQAEPTEQAR